MTKKESKRHRLLLVKGSKKKKQNMKDIPVSPSSAKWSPLEIELLSILTKKGKGIKEIAKIMKKTSMSIDFEAKYTGINIKRQITIDDDIKT